MTSIKQRFLWFFSGISHVPFLSFFLKVVYINFLSGKKSLFSKTLLGSIVNSIAIFFLLRFSVTDIDNSQDSRGWEGNHFILLYLFHPLTNIQTFICNFAYEMTTRLYLPDCYLMRFTKEKKEENRKTVITVFIKGKTLPLVQPCFSNQRVQFGRPSDEDDQIVRVSHLISQRLKGISLSHEYVSSKCLINK